MALGNIAAIAQTNLKRMLAYSTIAHMGFMLLGLLSGVVGGNWLNAADAYSAAMFYIDRLRADDRSAPSACCCSCRARASSAENLDDFKGLNQRSPWYAFMMLLADVLARRRAADGGLLRQAGGAVGGASTPGQIWLAVVAVLFSLIGAFYYLRIVKLMYFDEPERRRAVRRPAPTCGVLLSANGLALLALGILPQPLMSLCFVAIKSL